MSALFDGLNGGENSHDAYLNFAIDLENQGRFPELL
jgi:hypothetical protein